LTPKVYVIRCTLVGLTTQNAKDKKMKIKLKIVAQYSGKETVITTNPQNASYALKCAQKMKTVSNNILHYYFLDGENWRRTFVVPKNYNNIGDQPMFVF
jgi:hypothetical protein